MEPVSYTHLVLSLASVLRDTAKYPICDNGNYHYRNLCRRGREKGGSGVPVYAFGGGTFLWFLPARRIVQRRSTGRGHADDSKDTGLRLEMCIRDRYDGQPISAPNVKEPITGGQCRIDGMGSFEEAENLAATIRIGSLSLELEELRSNVVGAKLGQEAISTSLKAGAIGFGIVVVFMIFAYLIPGLEMCIRDRKEPPVR